MSLLAEPETDSLSSVREPITSTLVTRPEHNGVDRPARPSTALTPDSHAIAEATSGPTQTASCDGKACNRARAEAAEPVLAAAQRRWAARSVIERLQPIRAARHWMAAHPELFAQAISPRLVRAGADTLTAELLPLLDAMRFLERDAERLLAPRKLGAKHRPLWLMGVRTELHRDPLGHVLVIGPANFPLFLPGVQTLQALVAGNAVTWKPGTGGAAVAVLLAHALREAGLPRGILHVTDDSIEAAETALAQRPDKVVFTGSYNTGRQVLRSLAETATPAVMELSGADAVVVLPSADLKLAAKAIAFGLRLNGAEVCMSPRRVVATRGSLHALAPILSAELARLPDAPVASRTAQAVQALLIDALAHGAELIDTSRREGPTNANTSSLAPGHQLNPTSPMGTPLRPILLNHATPEMTITRADLFAPVLSLIEAPSLLHIPDLVNDNPYGLTAAVFGAPMEASTLAAQLRVGTVLINDLIAPTADPRMPFGGRRQSGFGLTRGAEGLLEMTAVKTILRRRKGLTRHYDPLGTNDLPLFASLIGILHAGSLAARVRALRRFISASRTKNEQRPTKNDQKDLPCA